MTITDVALELIDANPWQTRDHEDPEHLAEVAASIGKVGLLQNLVGRMAGQRVQLAFGHTRLAAYRKLNAEWIETTERWSMMPVDVRELTDQEMFELAVRENLERKDLTPIEEARAMAMYRDTFGKTSEEIGELFHLSASAVRNKMRLLDLPAQVQERVGAEINEGTARKLLTLQKLAPDRVQGVADNLVKGGFETAEAISNQITDVLQEAAFCMAQNWYHREDEREDEKKMATAGQGLWRLDWKGAVKAPTFAGLAGMLPDRFAPQMPPPNVLEELIGAFSSGVDVAGVVKLYGMDEDLAAHVRQLVAPPPCTACDFHQVLDGSHYCGIKACWEQKRKAWIDSETRRISKKLGIPIYNPAADGKAHVSAPMHYGADGRELDASWQKFLEAKDKSLRVRGVTAKYEKHGGTGSYVVELLRVGKPAEEAKKRAHAEQTRYSSGSYDPRAAELKRQREDAAERFVIEQAAPILASALVNGESVAGLEMILRTLEDIGWGRSPDRGKLPEKKAQRAARLRELIAAHVLLAPEVTDLEKGPTAVAKHLQGVAKTLGARLPKEFDEMAAALEPVSTETVKAKRKKAA